MRSLTLKVLFLLTAVLAAAGNVTAEDIDVYSGNSSGGNSNLLIVLDNSGSWNGNANTAQCLTLKDASGVAVFSSSNLLSSAGGVQACGLWSAVNTIGSIPSLLGKLNMGVMLLGSASVNGGVFKFPAIAAPSALVNMDAVGIDQMKTVLQGLSSSGGSSDTSNGRDFGGSTWEAWAFYTGNTGASGTTYPGINTATCGKNFVIRVGIADNNAQPGDYNAGQVQAALSSAITSASADPALLNYISPTWISNNKFSSDSNFWGDEWTRFMKQINDITTYTITLVDTSASDTQNVSAYKEYMRRTALVGGGKEFVIDINDMEAFVQALLAIFNEIQAVNSVFAAASLPISVNASGTFLNQIYMGMFRPEATGLPRWAGNLKQYQFKLDTSDPLNRRLFMADSLDQPAINAAGTGFFSPIAVSFWTSKNTAALPDSIDPTGGTVNGSTPGGFFIFNPQGTGEGFDLPDGEVVEKGGVAQQIRLENLTTNYAATPTAPRRLYTCTTGTTTCGATSSLSATPFATTNDGVTDTLLAAGIPGTTITSIALTGTTALVTLGSSMSPVLADGETVTISGSAYSQFNGQFVAGGPPTATSFTIPVNVIPPTPSTGTYTASVAGSVPVAATSITRINGTTARVNLTGHGFLLGQSVVIAGAGTGFDTGAGVITAVPDTDNFEYTVTVAPSTAGGGGTLLKVGDPAANQRNIEPSPTGIVINLPASDASPFNASVTVTATANLPTGGNAINVGDSVTISGASPAEYNGTWIVTGTGNACTGGGTNPKKFCFNIPTTPATATAGATVAATGALFDVRTITRTTACTAPVTPASTVTVETTAAHSFAAGQAVTISGTVGANEALYTGSQTILTVPTTSTFTYDIATVPACSDNIAGMTASALGVTRDTLIRWVRGEDSRGDEDSPGSGITIRPSIHGDVLHSRPAVVDYGGTTGVVVFYGANDGVFRAINGNQGDSTDATVGVIGTVPPGGELWGFIPTEFYSNLKRMYLNSPVVKLSSTSSAILPAPQAKNYFFDGGAGVFQDVTNGTVYLFLSARRGGRLIYALDVSNPADPKLLWKRSNTDTGFSELGQTWSQPKVALVKGYVDGGGNPKPVLIFGAGYDPAEDAEPPTANTMGRGIFILDALTGDIVWQAGPGGPTNDCVGTPCLLADMNHAIPSDVTLIDREIADVSGFVDRLYVSDLGGNVWRVDLEPTAGNTPDKWQVSKFASVGGTGATKRKLFFPPDVVTTKTFDAVLFSTGDREHPTLDQASVNIVNRFYMLKDTTVASDACPIVAGVRTCQATIVDDTSSTADDPPTGLFNASFILPSSPSSQPTSPGPAYDQSGNGFYITLRNAVATKNAGDGTTTYGPAIETGEKAVNAPTTVGGFTFFGTNTPIPPDPSVCQPNLGTARGYRVNFITGEAKFVVFAGGGLPPSPVAGVVNVDGVEVPFLIGGGNPDPGCVGPDCLSSVGGQEPPIPITPLRSRVFWYRDLGNR